MKWEFAMVMTPFDVIVAHMNIENVGTLEASVAYPGVYGDDPVVMLTLYKKDGFIASSRDTHTWGEIDRVYPRHLWPSMIYAGKRPHQASDKLETELEDVFDALRD